MIGKKCLKKAIAFLFWSIEFARAYFNSRFSLDSSLLDRSIDRNKSIAKHRSLSVNRKWTLQWYLVLYLNISSKVVNLSKKKKKKKSSSFSLIYADNYHCFFVYWTIKTKKTVESLKMENMTLLLGDVLYMPKKVILFKESKKTYFLRKFRFTKYVRLVHNVQVI